MFTPIPLASINRSRVHRDGAHDQLPSSFGEAAAAAFQDEREFTSTFSLVKSITLRGLRDNPDPSALVDVEEANTHGQKYGLTFDKPVNRGYLNMVLDRKERELRAALEMERYQGGLVGGAGLLGSRLLANLVDPLNVATAFIPLYGQTRYLNRLHAISRGNVLGATAGQVARARFERGVVEGVLGTAMLEPLVHDATSLEAVDYDFADSVLNLTFGGLLGGGLHAVTGRIGDAITKSDIEIRNQVTTAAIVQLATEGRVDVEGLAKMVSKKFNVKPGDPVSMASAVTVANQAAARAGYSVDASGNVRKTSVRVSDAGEASVEVSHQPASEFSDEMVGLDSDIGAAAAADIESPNPFLDAEFAPEYHPEPAGFTREVAINVFGDMRRVLPNGAAEGLMGKAAAMLALQPDVDPKWLVTRVLDILHDINENANGALDPQVNIADELLGNFATDDFGHLTAQGAIADIMGSPERAEVLLDDMLDRLAAAGAGDMLRVKTRAIVVTPDQAIRRSQRQVMNVDGVDVAVVRPIPDAPPARRTSGEAIGSSIYNELIHKWRNLRDIRGELHPLKQLFKNGSEIHRAVMRGKTPPPPVFHEDVLRVFNAMAKMGFSGEIKFLGAGVQSGAFTFSSHPGVVLKLTRDVWDRMGLNTAILPESFRTFQDDLAARIFMKGGDGQVRFAVIEKLDHDVERVQKALVGITPEFMDFKERAALANVMPVDDHAGNFGFRGDKLVALDEGALVPLRDIIRRADEGDPNAEFLLVDFENIRQAVDRKIEAGKLIINDKPKPDKLSPDPELEALMVEIEGQIKDLEEVGGLDAAMREEFKQILDAIAEDKKNADVEIDAVMQNARCLLATPVSDAAAGFVNLGNSMASIASAGFRSL